MESNIRHLEDVKSELERLQGNQKLILQVAGEERWTVQAAMELNVPAYVIISSLFTRFQSRLDESFAMKVIAALRNQFGRHVVKKMN